MSFGPTHWCHPLATMHHVDSEEMSLFWEFEMRHHLAARQPKNGLPQPVLIRDMYYEYFLPRMAKQRDDWNNVSEDRRFSAKLTKERERNKEKVPSHEKTAHKSLDACRSACEAIESCFQYSYFGASAECAISNSFKIGYPMPPEADRRKRQTSGWLTERILKWVDAHDVCGDFVWPDVVPRRWRIFDDE